MQLENNFRENNFTQLEPVYRFEYYLGLHTTSSLNSLLVAEVVKKIIFVKVMYVFYFTNFLFSFFEKKMQIESNLHNFHSLYFFRTKELQRGRTRFCKCFGTQRCWWRRHVHYLCYCWQWKNMINHIIQWYQQLRKFWFMVDEEKQNNFRPIAKVKIRY